jgi:hypothetical protein
MDVNAVFEKYSREDLIRMILDDNHKLCQLEHIITGCAEELHKLGFNDEVFMKQLETLVPAHSLGYHLGDYNCMRESIKMLTAQVIELGAEPVKFRWKFPWLDQGGTDGQST